MTDFFDINSSRNDLHIFQGELGTLGDNIPVDDNHCTAIIVEPITIATLLVGIEVDASALYQCISSRNQKANEQYAYQLSRLGNQIHASVKLLQLMMAS